MTNKEKKEYLQQVYRIEVHIKSLILEKDDILSLKEKCLKCTPNYHSDGSSGGSHANGTENDIVSYISALQKYENELTAEIDKLIDTKNKIKKIIEMIPDSAQREILLKRYINFQKWERIAVDMNYNIKWIYKLHGMALDNLKISD